MKDRIEEILVNFREGNSLNITKKAIEAEFAKRCEGITPELLHKAYLQAIANLNGKDFNHMADRPYEDLTAGQKSIDNFIATAVKTHLRGEK